ncbi:G-protein coupled receptor GRL101-like [Pecten maximus]|uniref:G-protein coupled receptor GRL101-like n=1 Tax=Pecten maximus TaxID=6579 RepID=UPI001458DEC0|nr:G-protein coupled receptor GRL101-like [Pecten maximus]
MLYLVTSLYVPDAFPVSCKFLKKNGKDMVQTIIHHTYEDPITVTQGKTLNQHITYTLPKFMIEKIKDENVCYQTISMKCHFTILQSTSWQGGFTNETKLFSLKTTDDTCSCPMFFNCDTNQTRCNCSTTAHDWYTASTTEVRQDSGIIHDERYLPVLQITASVQAGQQRNLVLHVGPLICENDNEVRSERYLCRSKISINYTHKCLRDYDEYGELKGCQDLSHLDDCEHFVCPSDYVKCPGRYCIPARLVCDGTDHCPSGQDEKHCDDSCPGLYRCHASNMCIPVSSVCDELQECPNGDDEEHCYSRCPDACLCIGFTVMCRGVSSMNDTIDLQATTRKLIFIQSDFSTFIPAFNFGLLGELNLSNSGITELRSRNFFLLKNLYSLDLSYNGISRIIASAFEGLNNLRFLNLEGNVQLRYVYEDSFSGLLKLPEVVIAHTSITSLPKGTFKGLDSIQSLRVTDNGLTKVEDDAFASLSSLAVLDMRGNEIIEFSDGIFRGLSNLTKLYTDTYMFCCLKPENVTDANCFPYQDEFSSCDDLMREDMLRAFLWIIGLCAFFGNICVVMYKCTADKRTLKKAHGILIINLGISDFCMGVYMLIIASADSAFRGRYVWNDIAWRYGNTCKLAGVLATVSSEASVIFLLLITIDRFVTIKFPLGQVQFGPRKAKCACGIVWLSAMSVAILPLMATGYFKGSFYSRSAVCLALPLTRDRPPGWEFGTILFIFLNFFVFVGIAIGQIFIYKEISSDDKMLKSQRHFQDAAIARSLFLVVFSDFLCWFPVGVMGLMALSGEMIPASTYAWTAVFILPINSALNPVIYTFTGILKKKKYPGLNFGRSLKKSAYDANTWKVWTALSQNQLFMLGNHPTTYTPLEEVMTRDEPRVRAMYKVVLELMRGLTLLHGNDMVNGPLTDDTIFLTVQNKKVTRVVIRLDLAVQDTEKSENICDVGKLTITLLRWYQKHIRKTKKKLSRLGAQ